MPASVLRQISGRQIGRPIHQCDANEEINMSKLEAIIISRNVNETVKEYTYVELEVMKEELSTSIGRLGMQNT